MPGPHAWSKSHRQHVASRYFVLPSASAEPVRVSRLTLIIRFSSVSDQDGDHISWGTSGAYSVFLISCNPYPPSTYKKGRQSTSLRACLPFTLLIGYKLILGTLDKKYQV